MPEPENKPAPEGDKGPTPAIDLEAVKSAASEAVQDVLRNWQPPEPVEREPSRTPEPTVRNPLADVIGPLVNPALRHLGTEIADAKDAALFYVEHPKLLKHKQGIEAAFDTLKRQGTPMTRDAVAKWYKGQHYDEFRKEDEEETKAAAERAKDAADMGSGASRERRGTVKDAHLASDEELARALDGVAF